MKTKTSLLLSLLLLVAALPARAETETVDGVEWTYRVENGFALLGGGTESTPAVPAATSGALAIPSSLGGFPVRSIPDYAFQRCVNLTAVEIPSGVTNIAYHAFYGCLRLASVAIPDGVSAIGGNAFFGCAFETIELPGSLKTIDYMAFYGCRNLAEVVVPGGVRSIGTQAFCKCPVLESVVLEHGVEVVGKNAFEDCPRLGSVFLPGGLEWINEKAFLNCTALESLVVPDSVTTVNADAFSGCSNLASLSLPATFKGKTAGWDLPATCEVTFRKRLTTVEAEATSIDLRPDPRKVDPGASERLTFGSRWAGSAAEAAAVEIALDGTRYLTLPGGEGTFGWTPDRGGLFTFTHTALDATGRALGDPCEASFLVENFSFGDGDIVAEDYEGVYDGAMHGISVSCTVPGATVKFAQSQEGPFTTANFLYGNHRTGTKTWYVVEAPFYASTTNYATVTITPRPLSVTAEAKGKVYGEADPALTYTADGIVPGETPLSGALSREAGENSGTYAIGQGTLAASANYALSFTGAEFTIHKATMPGTDLISWNVSGDAARFVYDGAEHSVALTGLPEGVTATYEGNCATDAGEYTATAHLVYDTANYEAIPDPAPLAWGIDKRPLAVVAEAKGKVYGEADPALTYTADGIVPGETPLNGALTREAGENAGTYAIGQGTLAASANYALSFTGAEFTITKATMPGADAIAWGVSGDAARFVYDGTEHGVALTGLPDGVTATYEGNRATDAGEYTATAHLVYDTANYEAIPDPAPLAWGIDKRPLAVVAEAKGKVYGEADPALTYTADGIVPGETPLSGALTREAGENAGTYAIKQGTLAASANYALSFTGAEFTISKATMPGTDAIAWNVSGDAARFVYDGAEHGVALTGLPEGVTVTYEGNKATDAGEYVATAHLIYDTANYEAIPDPAPLVWGIDKRPATVRSADGAWTYDTTEHSAPEVETGGFVSSEGGTADSFAAITDVGETANAFSWHWNAGTKESNYALALETGTLRVTPRFIGDEARNWDIRLGRNPLYDGAEKAAPVVQVCYVKPDGNLVSIPYALSGDDKATDAGNYAVTISGTGNYA